MSAMEVDEPIGNGENHPSASEVGQQRQNGGMTSMTSSDDKIPSWKLDLLMEKLRRTRSKANSLADTARNLRNLLMERRLVIDQDAKAELQKSLDVLQQSIKVTSLQSMIERLEMVSRQQGLRFTTGSSGNEWFISSDMFYLELVIDPQGVVQEVKIQHDGKAEQQSCPEIVQSLRRHDFKDYAAHLEGLVSIYQLNADKKTKSKVFIALQALETDLASMASTYSHITDGETVVMKSLIGLLQPRRGGHPVKLVFYITPYEFLDLNTKGIVQADVETILEKKLGVAATVSVQAYNSHKLQMNTTVTIGRTPDGKSIPRYGTLNATNSTALPACFTVNLAKGIPMCKELLQAIQTTTGIHCFDFSDPQPILNLVTKHVSNGSLNCENGKGLFVDLPDQAHCYYMTETSQLEGIMVSTISFTLASQLPQVIATLRQQLTFNTLVGSCVRVGTKPDTTCIVFEVNALSHQNLTVSFQHPLEDSLVTLEFDLRDVSHPQCRLHAIANAADIIPTLEEYACKVVHRTMSIPVTLRAVIRRWRTMKVKTEPSNQDHIRVNASSFGGDSSFQQTPDVSCGAESERLQNQQQSQGPTQQLPGIVMNMNLNKPRVSQNSSFTISPINATNPFPSQQPPQPMDMISTYMNNPLFSSLSNFQQNMSGLNLQNLTPNMALQMMAASQMQGKATSSMLMGLLDQVGQRGKRKKRKGTSDDNLSAGNGSNFNMPRPSPSPSPKSMPPKSPIRRLSSEFSDLGVPTPPTPQTPTSNTAINLLMTELGLEHPDPRWNIDITPVTTPTEKFTPNKMNFGSAQLQEVESMTTPGPELEIEVGKFPVPASKKAVIREGVKRSMSLDSSAMGHGHHGSLSFDPLDNNYKITPSLSITPVTGTTSTVNSLLAAMRPGIEIIPLPNPVSIPNSITVTPIMPKQPPQTSQQEKMDKKVDEAELKRKLLEKKERKRKLEADANAKNMSSMRPKSMQIKKPRPTLPNPATSIAKTLSSSLGKPSVSTLKSVSVSVSALPKYPEMSMNKPKLPKPGPLSSQAKIVKTFSPGGPGVKPETTVQVKTEPVTSNPSAKPEQKLDVKPKPSMSPFLSGGGGAGKKGGLLAVIDKLKSQQHSTVELEPKKDLSKLDFLKVASAVTSELAKKNAGMPGMLNPEYMIKQGQGQSGLKLTINKTKTPSKEKKGLGLVPIKRGISPSGLKSPKLVTKKIVPPLTALSMKNPKGSPNPTEEIDLTKKLFMPGAVRSLESGVFDGPKFDTKFQIPKKNRNVVATEPPPKDKTEESPPQAPVPKEIKDDGEDSVNDPPTLSIAATSLSDESEKDEPPVLSAQVLIPVEEVSPPAPVLTAPDFISPESPDQQMSVEEAETPTIPTTPLNVVPIAPSPRPEIPQIQSPDKSPDPDALIMEVDEPPEEPCDLSVSEPKEPEVVILEEEKEAPATIMPPPPAPPVDPIVAVPSPVASALPIVSVHIVHSPSPQPASPALLRSPLVVVPSPHSAHASPYTIIDDDLMDEALIG